MVFGGVHNIVYLFHFHLGTNKMNGTKAFREKCSFRSKISEVILAFVYQGMQTIFDSVCSLLLFESHMPITGGVIAVDVQKNRACRR